MTSSKEERECWILGEFCKALSGKNSHEITIECGEDGYSDGRLIIDSKKIPVEIVTAERILYERAALARRTGKPVVYEIRPIEWIKGALKLKVAKNYAHEKELLILIEYGGLESINEEYLLLELKTDEEIISFAKRFKDVYILNPSSSEYVDKDQKEPFLVKIEF